MHVANHHFNLFLPHVSMTFQPLLSYLLPLFLLLLHTVSTVHIYLETPCLPSPCGPHSHCREVNYHAVCSCVTNYFGAPPNCKPECVVSSECSADKACANQRCIDPCPGTCGLNARCQVVNHNAICSCDSGFIGDPFVRCVSQPSKHVLPYFLYALNFCLCHHLLSFSYSSYRTYSTRSRIPLHPFALWSELPLPNPRRRTCL